MLLILELQFFANFIQEFFLTFIQQVVACHLQLQQTNKRKLNDKEDNEHSTYYSLVSKKYTPDTECLARVE